MTNRSGINPVEFNVLVLQDAVEEKTQGGLIRPAEVMDREKHGATIGTLIALSPMAFNSDIWPSDQERPAPGVKVIMAKYAGIFVKGDDGVEYRLCKDKDVIATMGQST